MYNELINLLRRCGKQKCKNCEYEHVLGCVTKMNERAADAIEELSKRSECPCWYGGIRFCAMLSKPIPEPPKEET